MGYFTCASMPSYNHAKPFYGSWSYNSLNNGHLRVQTWTLPLIKFDRLPLEIMTQPGKVARLASLYTNKYQKLQALYILDLGRELSHVNVKFSGKGVILNIDSV